MKQYKLWLPIFMILLNTGCASFGPKIVIETPVQAEDFVVLCMAEKSHFIGHNASSYDESVKTYVVKSGEKVDCGLLLGGDGGVRIMHPVYTGDGKQNYTKDGVEHIVFNKTKLDVLDDLKAKFEAGEWDKYKGKFPGPESLYISSLPNCDFGHKYFEYYKESKEINIDHFMNIYHEPLLECFTRKFKEIGKYDPYTARKLPSAEEWMKKIWGSRQWK
jgi:hypothetical protein